VSQRAPRTNPVAIVGAGLAGLSAAVTLAESGVTATVFEASDRVGGRVHSGPEGYWDAGQTSEWCGELIDSGHGAIRELAGRFALRLIDMHADGQGAPGETFHIGGAPYLREEAERDFEAIRDELDRDLAAAGPETSWATSTKRGVELDRMSVRDWIETRVPGGSGSRLGRLLDVVYTAEYAADTTDQSALNLVYMLGEQPPGGGFAPLGESDERFHIEGGGERLVRALESRLVEPVELGARVSAIWHEGGVPWLALEDGRRSSFDHILLAIPFAVLREIDYRHAGFDERKREAIEQLGAGNSVKLALQFKDRHWLACDSDGSSAADAGYATTWERTRGQSGGEGILVVFAGGSAPATGAVERPRSDATSRAAYDYARESLEHLEPVYPGLTELWNEKASLSVPIRDPLKRCSYPYYRVGQYHRFGGYEGVRSGNFHFAGDHCSQDLQGFMEGAVTEGQRATREILGDLG
jgi:monoamine oxidase